MAAQESAIKESRRCAIWVVVEKSVLRESVRPLEMILWPVLCR
jgi:hypothetical protein